MNCDDLSIKPPNFRHAEGGVDIHPINPAARHVHFDREVGWRIFAEVYFIFLRDGSDVGDVKALIRLKAALDVIALMRERAAAHDFQVKVTSENEHNKA